jgi:hypothetical protein
LNSRRTQIEQLNGTECPWLMPIILATGEAEIGRILFEVTPGKLFLRPNLQNNQRKMDWRLCKCEALNSNPSPNNKKRAELNKETMQDMKEQFSNDTKILKKIKLKFWK